MTVPPIDTPPTLPQDEYSPDDFIDDDTIIKILQQENPVIVVADLDGSVISEEALQAIAENGVDVEIILDNGFTFTIIADSITPDAAAFDLNIEIDLLGTAQRIDGVNIPANSIVINPNFSGEFSFEIQFSFTAEELAAAGINGNNVKLWHVDYNGVVTDTGRVRLNADGSIEFTIGSASFYVLSEIAPIGTTPTTTPTSSTDGDNNPRTGVVISFTSVVIASGTLLLSKKQRRKNNFN